MNELVLGTQNKRKLEDFYNFLTKIPHSIAVTDLAKLHISDEPEETGLTFKENALLKAKYYANLTNLPVLADDGGPEIDALNGEPGVKSKLWLGRPATDQELIDYTMQRMQGVPYEKRTMSMHIYLCYFNPHTNTTLFSEGRTAAHVSEHTTKNFRKGFAWRAVMYIDKYNKFYDELTLEEHQAIDHRWIALKAILPKITRDLEQ